MRKGLYPLLICSVLMVLALPAGAVMTPYILQAENIPTAAWTNVTPATSTCTTSVITDPNAVGGSAYQFVDPGSNGTDQWGAVYKAETGGMGTTGTAVVRMRTSDATPFITDRWTRNIMFGFTKRSATVPKRSIGLAVRPDSACIVNTLGTQVYGGVIYGDNTQYVTWTIVARSNGRDFDLYRNGVKVVSNFTGQASGGESQIMTGDGKDCIAIGSGNNVYTPASVPPVNNPTGAWVIDGIAYQDGEHPYWNPINPSGVSGTVIDDVTRAPIAGATVTATGGFTTTTDANGDFLLTGMNMGAYSVTVVPLDGYYQRTLPVVLADGAVTNRTIELVSLPALTSVLYDNFERTADPGVMGATEDASHTPWTGNGTNLSITNNQLAMGPSPSCLGICPNGYGPADFDVTWKSYKNEPAAGGNTTDWTGFHYRGAYSDQFSASMLFYYRTTGEVNLLDAYNGVSIYTGTPVAGIDFNQEHTWRVRAIGPRHQAWLDGSQLYDVQYGIVNGGWQGFNRSVVNAIVDNYSVGSFVAPTGTVTGRVYNIDNPAQGVASAVVQADNGQEAICDANGNYTITLPASVAYKFTARGTDYYFGSVSGIQPLPATATTADIGLKHVPSLADSIVVTDHFTKPDGVDLGSTETPNAYPWVRGAGESGSSIASGTLYEAPDVFCSGSSVGGGFLPSDLDISVKLQMNPASLYWGGIAYRQGSPGTFDTHNGQPDGTQGYLVYCATDGQSVTLHRSGTIVTASVNIDWSTPHTLRVSAIGPHHKVWIDNVVVIDRLDYAKLSGGYAGLLRDRAEVWFDDLNVVYYTLDTGKITGTIYDAITNAPVAGARVMLSNGMVTTSGSDGRYELKKLPNGTYTVSAGSDTYYYRAYGNVLLNSQTVPAVQDLKLAPIPSTPLATIFDDFNRPDNADLGSTSVGNVPWYKAGETTTANISANMLALTDLSPHGVSLDRSIEPVDLDMSVQLTILGSAWGGIAYRQAMPGVYDTIGGQPAASAGYLVWCTADGRSVNLWRNGYVATAHLDDNPMMWYYWPMLRVRAIGAHHEVFVDRGWGTGWEKVIDCYDSGKIAPGYVGCFRDTQPASFDDFTLSVYGGPATTVTGTVTDSTDSSITIAGAKIRFGDGTVATSNADGIYTASVTSWGSTSLQAVADTYRQKTVAYIDLPLGGTLTQNISLGLLPDATPIFDSYTRADSIDCGVTEDTSHRGYSKAWDGIPQTVIDLTQIKDQQLALLRDDVGYMSGVSIQLIYPIDADMSLDARCEPLADGDWFGFHYRANRSGSAYLRGYQIRVFNDGTILFYFKDDAKGYQLIREIKLTTVPDWTQVHKFRVRSQGIKHSFWIDGQPIWTNVEDWGYVESGYAGVSHLHAALYVDNWNEGYDARLEVPQGKRITTVVEAKAEANSTLVTLTGPVVTARFSGFFYVEDVNRTAGIKVVNPTTVNPGDVVTIDGTIQTADGEKYINAAGVSVNSQTSLIKPIGLSNRSNAPAVGLSNIGLLTTIWGKILSVSGDQTYCYIDDGSGVGGTGIKVLIAGTKKPVQNSHVSCTGIARITAGGVKVLHMRSDDDLVVNAP